MGMITSSVENKNIFKFFLFIWIMALPFKNAVYQISVILIILYFIVHIIKTKNINILKENLKVTIPLFIGFSFIIFAMLLANLLNLEYLDKKSWHLIYMFIIRYAFIFIILAYFYRLEYFDKKEIVVVLFASFSLLAITGIYEIIQDPNVIFGVGITGTLDNRNAFGLFMGMGFVLSLLLMEHKRNLGITLILIFSFLMIFSFSRSCWVASVTSSFIFFLINYKKIRLNHFIYLFIFLGFLLVLYFSFDSFQERFAQLLQGNSSFRTTIWSHTIVLIKEELIFGYGLDSWQNLSDPYLKQFPDPHNMVLEILTYIGLIGLIACFFTIGVILYKIFKDRNFVLLSVVSYFLVVTQFDFGAFYSKELLSFLTIFVFFVYSNSFKQIK